MGSRSIDEAKTCKYGLPKSVFSQILPKNPMGLKLLLPQTAELFRPRLDEQMNTSHPPVKLTAPINWSEIKRTFTAPLTSGRERPALSLRRVAGLPYLQHTFDGAVENPYWQFFCGRTYLQTERPIDPTSLTRWKKHIGEEGVETLHCRPPASRPYDAPV